jgi:23S rRNA (cytosine1962-C5)-methyltransferase
MPAKIFLKRGKERPILRGHPWVFSGAVESIEGYENPGDLCDVHAHDGSFLARGYANRRSQITCRILTREDVPIDRGLFGERIERALKYRRDRLPPETDAYRLVNAEGDLLPGLTVDVYGKGLVCQFQAAGMERWKEQIVSLLMDLLRPDFIFERSDLIARQEEGLKPASGLLSGRLDGPVEIREHGHRFLADVSAGQKTGFYLDQRENRRLFASLAAGKRVCDCFCYTGGFSVYGATAGAAAITAVDSSRAALDLARKHLSLNVPGQASSDLICQDVFTYLRELPGPFDLMVVDPPPFARRASDRPQASRGYKDVNLWALKNLSPGGHLLTFSCSRAIDWKLFGQIIFAAAVDAGREVQIVARLGMPPDHPVSIFHPQGEYLKGLALHVF